MKRAFKSMFLSLLLCAALVMTFTGCDDDTSGGTIDEPEITGEYLAGEYAQQLTTDGAEVMSALLIWREATAPILCILLRRKWSSMTGTKKATI